MPIYEYERQDGSRFEIRQGFHDAALTTCPTTGQTVRRVLSPAGIIFKGSGWYITDSRPSSSTSSTSSSESSSAESQSTEPKSTEPKSTEPKSGGEAKAESSTAKKSDAAA